MNMIEDNNEIASIPVPKIPENESEFYPLKTSEAIDNINSKINKISSDNKFKLLNQILYFLFILAFILIFFQFISLIAGDKTDISENDDKFTNLLNSNNSKQLNNNSSLLLDEEISNPEKKNNSRIFISFFEWQWHSTIYASNRGLFNKIWKI